MHFGLSASPKTCVLYFSKYSVPKWCICFLQYIGIGHNTWPDVLHFDITAFA